MKGRVTKQNYENTSFVTSLWPPLLGLVMSSYGFELLSSFLYLLSFYLGSLNFFLIFEGQFCWVCNSNFTIFSLSTLNISAPCFLVSKAFHEKLTESCWWSFVYEESPFSGCFQGPPRLLIVWLSCVFVWISLSLTYLEFIELLGLLDSCISSNLVSFQSFFLQMFSLLFFWNSHSGKCWSVWWCPTDRLGSVHFSWFFFFYLCNSIIFNVISSCLHIPSSACQISIAFFNYWTFKLQNLFLVLFVILSLFWYSHFLHAWFSCQCLLLAI